MSSRSTPEGTAIARGDIDAVKALQADGYDLAQPLPGSDLWNALHLALSSDRPPIDPEFIRYLIDQGADVAAQDRYGMAPLHYAARAHRTEICQILIDAGAPINARTHDRNQTALSLAIVFTDPSPECLDVLLAAGSEQHNPARRNWLRNLHTAPGHAFMKDLITKYIDPEPEPE